MQSSTKHQAISHGSFWEKYFPTQPILEYLHCKMVIATLTLHSSPGFYDPTELVYSPAHSPAHSAGRTTRLEQTIFLVLASLAGVAFMVIITLLLCRFQCQVASSTSSADTISSYIPRWAGPGPGRATPPQPRPRPRPPPRRCPPGSWWRYSCCAGTARTCRSNKRTRTQVDTRALNELELEYFAIIEKALTRLKAPASAFTFKTLLRHYAKRVSIHGMYVKLGRKMRLK